MTDTTLREVCQRNTDNELRLAAHDQRYEYNQGDNKQTTAAALFRGEQIYQSYDQNREETTPMQLREQKDYDTITTDEEDSSDQMTSEDSSSDELTKRTLTELIVCVLAFIGRGLCLNSIGPTLIDLRQIADITIPQAAAIFVSQSIGFLIGSVAAKILLQRLNNELVMSICLTVQALCTAFVPTFSSLVLMCFMFVGQGFAIGVVGIGVCAACIRLGGPTRNGMFLQAVYLGTSIGSVVGPFIAKPFLSVIARNTDNHELDPNGLTSLSDNQLTEDTDDLTKRMSKNSSLENVTLLSTTVSSHLMNDPIYTDTKIQSYYIIIAVILCIPAVLFLIIFITRNKNLNPAKSDNSEQYSLAIGNCTAPLLLAIILMFIQCLLYFGIQDTYSNLLTTFAVLGPLHLNKPTGVYLTSLFWASMCFGRLNGIWIAKLVSPFKILLAAFGMASLASTALVIWADKSSVILWGFTGLLGLSFACVNGATVSWAAGHLPKNNYILSIIMIGRCCGLLLLPTAVTALFKINGAMTLMYAAFSCVLVMLTTILLAQGLAYNYGTEGRIYGKKIPHKS